MNYLTLRKGSRPRASFLLREVARQHRGKVSCRCRTSTKQQDSHHPQGALSGRALFAHFEQQRYRQSSLWTQMKTDQCHSKNSWRDSFKLLVEALGMCARVAAYKVATKVLDRLPVEPLWRLGVLGKILGQRTTEIRLIKATTKPFSVGVDNRTDTILNASDSGFGGDNRFDHCSSSGTVKGNIPKKYELSPIAILANNMASIAVERALSKDWKGHPKFGIMVDRDKWSLEYQLQFRELCRQLASMDNERNGLCAEERA